MSSASTEASDLLRRLVEPAPVGAHIETLIRSAAHKLGFTYSRAKSLWYGEARAILSIEMDALRSATRAKQDEAESVARANYRRIQERLERIEAALLSSHANHRGECDSPVGVGFVERRGMGRAVDCGLTP